MTEPHTSSAAATELVFDSVNNPMADYAEGPCAKALNLTLAAKVATGYDGIDPSGKKIEVKARRLTEQNASRQLSAIRGIAGA